jgi:prefoldin subunit 5
LDGNGTSDEPRIGPALRREAEEGVGRIRRAIKDKTERIPLRALEKRGFRSVQVLDMATIERIVAEAVEHALSAREQTLLPAERAVLEADAKQEFLKLLDEHKRVVKEKSDLERAREGLESQVATLREELMKQREALRTERDRKLSGETFSLSAESFGELESKIRKLFSGFMNEERRLSLAELGPRALKGLSELEKELALMLDRLLADEREKLVARERKAHGEKVEILEKRIEKLNRALRETEQALATVIAAKSIDPGIASIYKTVQGLAFDALHFERKKELLKEVFLENLVLQKKDVRPEDRSDAPFGRPAPPPPPPPGDFAPPLEAMTEETAY